MDQDRDLSTRCKSLRLFLCGDVMCGRGIDQVLAHPCSPEIYEDYIRSAEDYVLLAEQANGFIPRRNGPSYVWGAALQQLTRMQPDARIINLETAVTRSGDRAPKGINYRMSPENAACLGDAKIDCCTLANNHVLDWAAAGDAPGVNLLSELSETKALLVADQITALRRPGDLVVVSIHWGTNWGYHVPDEQRKFAHTLIDQAGVSIIHGHSSHHPRPIEIYRNRLILYGCGDFLNDYEGIRGYERYRDDLTLMYFIDLEPTGGCLQALKLVPLQIKNFQLTIPSQRDIEWIQGTLDRECRRFGTKVLAEPEGRLMVASQPPGDV